MFAFRNHLTYKRDQRTRFPSFQRTIEALSAPYVYYTTFTVSWGLLVLTELLGLGYLVYQRV